MITPSLYADYSKMQEEILNIYSFFEKSAKTLNIKRKQTRKASGMMNIFCINKRNIPHICIFMQHIETHGFGTCLALGESQEGLCNRRLAGGYGRFAADRPMGDDPSTAQRAIPLPLGEGGFFGRQLPPLRDFAKMKPVYRKYFAGNCGKPIAISKQYSIIKVSIVPQGRRMTSMPKTVSGKRDRI